MNQKNIYNLFFDLLNKFLKKNNFVPQRILVLRYVNNNQKQMNEEIFSLKEIIDSCPIKNKLTDTKICYVHCSSKHNLKII